MARKQSTGITPEMIELADRLGVTAEEVRELAAEGFTLPDTDTHHRLIVSTSARDKYGKTDWALRSSPEPIAFIDTDLGTEGLMNREPFSEKKIIRKLYNLRQRKRLAGEEITKSEIEEEWHSISSAIRTVTKSPLVKTLVIDTATEVWEIARLAYLGKLTQVMPHQYVEVNKAFREVIQTVYARNDLNAIFIHKMKKEYINDKFRGTFETSGFSDMPFLVQVNVQHLKDEETGLYGIKVVNCRQNNELDGEELWGGAGSFARLGRAVYPDSKKEDWE